MASRPDPEQLLRQAQAEDRYARRGRLKIFLGYTARVGKSYRMLDEGRRRAARGEDVVVGALQQSYSAEIEAILAHLEVIPMRIIDATPVVDVAALLARRPHCCLIDGLANSNPPGSGHRERWQDAEELLEAGISVIASVNLQFIAERRAAVESIIGQARGGPVVPEEFVRSADEIEVVDAPPEAAAPDNVRQLTELREIALLLAADVVDQQLAAYLRRHGIEQSWGAHERILLCLGDAPAEAMIASGQRNAARFHGDLLAVHVAPPRQKPSAAVLRNMELARQAGAELVTIEGADFVHPVLGLARERGATQIFLGHARLRRRWQPWRRGALYRLIRQADGIDIRIFPAETSVALES